MKTLFISFMECRNSRAKISIKSNPHNQNSLTTKPISVAYCKTSCTVNLSRHVSPSHRLPLHSPLHHPAPSHCLPGKGAEPSRFSPPQTAAQPSPLHCCCSLPAPGGPSRSEGAQAQGAIRSEPAGNKCYTPQIGQGT